VGNVAGGAGSSVPIHQGGRALFVEPLVHLKWKLFLGPRYQWRSLGVTLEGQNLPPDTIITPKEFNSKTAALGFQVQQDRRDSQFYPEHGTLAELVGDFFHPAFGSDLTYQSYWFAFNNFSGLSPRQVLAFRVYGCIVAGDVPFYDLCLMGAHNDLRGYEAGRYRDRLMLSTQVEYKLELPKRFGLAAFFGVGEVAPTIGSFNAANLLPAGGVGLRFLAAKKNHINLRFDYGIGKDGGGFYMGIAEAF
jgi:outer membrane protein assembly factor BamA